MMELLIFWGIPLIVAAIGYQRMFYRMFTLFICTLLAAYLGIWNTGWVAALFGFLPEGIRFAVAAVAGAAVTGAVLFYLFQALNPQNLFYAFPPTVERIGGILCGFLSGAIGIHFLGLVLCLTPLAAKLPSGLDADSIRARSTGGIMALTRSVNFVTLQSGRDTACRERLQELFAAANPKPEPAAAGPKKPEVRP